MKKLILFISLAFMGGCANKALTEQQVKGWVQSQIDEVAIKADINSQIESQKNPPVVIKKNPWSGEDEV